MVEVAKKSYRDELIKTAQAIVRPGAGILAADESTGTIGQRFKDIGVENIESHRRAYRDLLFTTPELEKHISGVIMYEETLDQATPEGVNFVELLKSKGILTGIKVDKGLVVIGGTNDESATTGLDGLAQRCATYYAKGARFAKWRAVLKIGSDGRPSALSIKETAHTLARYGSICQDNGLVPIIEPEILIDGDHTIEVCAEVSERVFKAVVGQLLEHKLLLEGLLIKPNMVTPGSTCPTKVTAQEIAWYTVRTLSRVMTPAIPGIVFLSGGQSEEDATLNLNEINKITTIKSPYALTFSYGRALQKSTLKAWMGLPENVAAAQAVLLARAKANGEASTGKYLGGSGGDTSSQHIANYSY
jgi:fructose-bisphosphate aldolase class I